LIVLMPKSIWGASYGAGLEFQFSHEKSGRQPFGFFALFSASASRRSFWLCHSFSCARVNPWWFAGSGGLSNFTQQPDARRAP